MFAAVHLPQDLPNYWVVALEYATDGREQKVEITADQAQMLVENLQEIDSKAFATDRRLLQELMEFKVSKSKPLGLILSSGIKICHLCGSTLKLRKDRPASIVIYDHDLGTVPCSHFHKYCSNRTCGCTQYYGVYTSGGSSTQVIFNKDWASLKYFVSCRETAFSLPLLQQFNAEILIGQMSFKQCADVYNFT